MSPYLQPKSTPTVSKDPNVVQSQQEEDDIAKGTIINVTSSAKRDLIAEETVSS